MRKLRDAMGLALAGVLGCGVAGAFEGLEGVVAESLETHPEVRAAVEGLVGARADRREARGQFGPQVSFRTGYGRERSESTILRNAGVDHRTSTREEYGLTVRQFVADWGGVRGRYRAFQARESATSVAVDETRLRVALRACEAFLEVRQQLEQVAIAEENVARKDVWLKRVEALKRGGVGRESDVAQARGRVSLARSFLVQRQAQLDAAKAQFVEAVGRLPGEFRLEDPIPEMALPDGLEAAIAEMQAEHPSRRRQVHEVDSSRHLVRAAQANFRPRVDAQLSASETEDVAGLAGDNNDRQALLVLTHTFSSGGAFQAAREGAQADLRRNRESLDALDRRLLRELAAEWANLVGSQGNALQLGFKVDDDLAVVRAFDEQFQLGKRTLFDLLNQDDQLFQSRSSLLSARYAAARGTYRVGSAMGSLVRRLGIEE